MSVDMDIIMGIVVAMSCQAKGWSPIRARKVDKTMPAKLAKGWSPRRARKVDKTVPARQPGWRGNWVAKEMDGKGSSRAMPPLTRVAKYFLGRMYPKPVSRTPSSAASVAVVRRTRLEETFGATL